MRPKKGNGGTHLPRRLPRARCRVPTPTMPAKLRRGYSSHRLLDPVPLPLLSRPSLYSTTVCQALRQTLRGGVMRELLRTPCLRTSQNLPSTHLVNKGRKQRKGQGSQEPRSFVL